MKVFFIKNFGFWLTALVFAFVINIPDIYSALTSIETWVPVNSPPYSIGDDYFYYGMLNKICLNGISLPRDHLNDSSLLSQEFIRILAYWINVPFYKAGYFLLDQRLGILFVRFFNAFFLYISIVFFLNKLSFFLKTTPTKAYTHLMAILFFFFFNFLHPPYTNILKIQYWFDGSYIYHFGQFNDLTRAIFSGTSGTVMLFAISYIISIFQNNEKSDKHFYIPLLMFTIFAFIHIPSAIVLFFVSGLIILFRYKILVFTKHKFKCLLMFIVFGGVVIFQKEVLSSTETAQELFNFKINFSLILSGESSTLMRFIKIIILATFPYILPIISFYFFRKEIPQYVFIIFFALTLFSIGTIFQNTHYNRFWYRGAIIPYVAFSAFFIIQIVIKLTKKYFSDNTFKITGITILFIVWGLMISFFYQNAKFMTKHYFRSTDKPELLNYIIKEKQNDNIVLTNSSEIIYYYNCYSAKRLFFQDYSFQSYGYKKNLLRAMENFALLGVSKEQLITLFINHPFNEVSNWVKLRPITYQNIESYTKSYVYSIYFLTTYFTYNNKLLHDIGLSGNKLQNTNILIDFINKTDLLNIRNKHRNTKFDIVLDQNASKILNTGKIDSFKYDKKIVLDDGKIVILTNAFLYAEYSSQRK